MFKKPLHNIKTSAPLKSSDRRKFKQDVLEAFALPAELGDTAVPEGLRSLKFSTHLDEHGVAYLSGESDNPLWFTIGIGSKDLIPSVYTLWQIPDLLPKISTPAPVIERMTGGADLMIPGVISLSLPPSVPSLPAQSLVSIVQYKSNTPVAVGRLALSTDELKVAVSGGAKGKAVLLLHCYKDHLWEMGTKTEPPISETAVASEEEEDAAGNGDGGDNGTAAGSNTDAQIGPEGPNDPPEVETGTSAAAVEDLIPLDVDAVLRKALIQSICTTLAKTPSLFPLPASTLYTAYLLPSRPPVVSQGPSQPVRHYSLATCTIKQSTHKKLAPFLKAMEKEGLIKLKEYKGELSVLSVDSQHKDVVGHRVFTSVGDLDAKEVRKAEAKAQESAKREVVVKELWKPHGKALALFEAAQKSTSALYAAHELKTILLDYITTNGLVHPTEQQYVVLRPALSESSFPALGAKPVASTKPSIEDAAALLRTIISKKGETLEYIEKKEAFERLCNGNISGMQEWYSVDDGSGAEPVTKKGSLKPISVVIKLRGGNKAVTIVANYELFGLNAEQLGVDLKKLCAGATSVQPGLAKNSGLEVVVQGKQAPTITSWLIEKKGVPRKWIETDDQTVKKKK